MSPLRPFAGALMLAAACMGQAHAVSAEAVLAPKMPKKLSEFGFFADAARQSPADDVLPFHIATPLFSDHAVKYRFVHVPEGASATYHANEAFDFPVGSALVKTFAFPADLSKPDQDVRLIETRVLLRQEAGWQAAAYVWNAEQSDADLKIAGAKMTVETVQDGRPLSIAYAVPNKNQCKGCHALNGEIVPLGPKARNLNLAHDYSDGAENQIARWSGLGILSGAPDPAAAQQAVVWSDETQPLEARARAWLDVNCAHCHRREGPASNSGLFLTHGETDRVALGIGKRPVAAGRGSGNRTFDIDAGNPENSILLLRVESTEPGVMMPELGRTVVDTAAVDLLRNWIAELR